MTRAGGGDERRAVRALVKTQSGRAEGATETLGEAERKTFFLAAGVIEKRGQCGIDRGGFGISGHRRDIDELEVRGGVMLGEMAFDGGEVGELFRIFPFARIILRCFRGFGAPFLDDFGIALHFEPRAKRFEIHAGKPVAMEFAQFAFEIVMVGRTEQHAGHAADGDDGKISFGRFDFDRFAAVKLLAFFAEQMAHGRFAREPHAVVQIDDPERTFGLFRRGGQIDGVGRGIAQENAGDVKKAERFSGVTDLRHHGLDRGGCRGESDAQPGKRIGGRRFGETFVAAGAVEFFAAGFGSASRSAALSGEFSPAGRSAAIGAGLAEFARDGGRSGRVFGPRRTEVEGAEVQRRGFVGHGNNAACGRPQLTR